MNKKYAILKRHNIFISKIRQWFYFCYNMHICCLWYCIVLIEFKVCLWVWHVNGLGRNFIQSFIFTVNGMILYAFKNIWYSVCKSCCSILLIQCKLFSYMDIHRNLNFFPLLWFFVFVLFPFIWFLACLWALKTIKVASVRWLSR